MNPDIARTVERVRRSRAAAEARAAEPLSLLGGIPATGTRALEVGARVFDLVTGQEGEVIGRTREDGNVHAPDRRIG
jgi:hypothetical protein